MGTSKSSSGPSSGIPLLPDWAIDNDNVEDNDGNSRPDEEKDKTDSESNESIPVTQSWRPVRTAFTSYLKNPSKAKLKDTVSKYVKASGGSKKIANSVIAGKAIAGHFSYFLSDVVKEGAYKALENLGIGDITGKSAEYVFTKLAELLAPKGNEADDPYARSAISETLSKIYEDFEINENDIDELDNLSIEKAHEFIEFYLSTYIFQRLMAELCKTLIDRKNYSEKEIIDREYEIKEYIDECIRLEFKDIVITKIDFSTNNGKAKITEIFNNAYSILEEL